MNEDTSVPANLTEVIPIKLEPEMFTDVPIGPDEGLKELITGVFGKTVKFCDVVVFPPGVVTEIDPVVALIGTTADMVEELVTVNDEAGIELNSTRVASVKLVPDITTLVKTGPDAGLNEETVGGWITLKLDVETPVPPGVDILIDPVKVPFATTAVIVVEFNTVKDSAAVPPNKTEVAPVKLLPVIVTVVPTGPEIGVNDVMPGEFGKTVNSSEEFTVPAEVVT